MMKKHLISALFGAAVALTGMNAAWAQDDRVIVDSEEGQLSCLFDGVDYSDCVPLDQLRYLVDTQDGQMACLWQNGEYVDCEPYGEPEYVQDNNNSVNDDSGYSNGVYNLQTNSQQSGRVVKRSEIANENQANSSDSQASYSSSSSSSSGYWDDDHGIPNGLTWGLTIGWFGQFYEGNNSQNGLSLGGDIGGKWTHFGVSLDFDISVSPTEKRFENFWTYSFHGLFMTFWPIAEGIEVTAGLGVGYTGWTLDYEYTQKYLNYDWYNDVYYVDDEYHSQNIDSGGFMSLKFKARIDFVFDSTTLGLEFDWIPWLDTKNSGKLVNNIFGIQLHVGGIE